MVGNTEKTGRGGRATMLDVGRLANVSGKTVSRVINADGSISPTTRERVLAAIRELDFRPNMAARSLRGERSFNICILTEHFSSTYFGEIMRGTARACSARDHHLIIEELPHNKPPADALRGLLDRVNLDGFILLPPHCDDLQLLDTLDHFGKPYVRMAPAITPERSPFVASDDSIGVAALAEHFWRNGHRKFGYIGGPVSHKATHERRESFIEALVKLGAQPADILVANMAEASYSDSRTHRPIRAAAETGATAIDTFLSDPRPPTAVFAFSDDVASGAVSRAHQRGLRIPADIAIAGFDDSDISQIMFPQLTTVRQRVAEMAADAVNLLIDRAASTDSRIHTVELIIRPSTTL